MKKIYLFLFFTTLSFGQVSWQGGVNPEQTSSATILFNKTGTGLASYNGTIYAHIGVTLNGAPWQNVIGTWGSNIQPSLTFVSGTTYKLDLTPTIQQFFNVSSGSISKINVVFRSETGSAQTTDLELNVGAFQSTLSSPNENSTTILNSGQNLNITANNTNGNASYILKANGNIINTFTGNNYSYTDSNIVINKSYTLEITQGSTTFTKKFNVLVNPGVISQAIPANSEDGINYNSSDATKATLVLTAPNKDFVYVAGSFNNWQPDSSYAMKKDPTTGKFWLELTGLTSGIDYTYQYWVVDLTPISNSPVLVKTADPYSTLVLSSFDDPWISSNSYPNMPTYPVGQDREVTVLKTGQTPYAWSAATTNFTKPNKDKLVVYEVLIRDFDADRNFQDLIDKIDYFKNLKINAIELMPIMEFEGNESWGYNTVYHMALDKFYGTKDKLKEFIDLCHQNNIAVILDLALNHAFGRNPMVRMWMKDPDGDGWGDPSSENPYFNEFAKHSYGVGADFNHSSALTKYYTKRVIKHWIEEFKIDGFRWDLTKGFTQACSSGDDTCTNNYQADRVAILKEYADYSWSLDSNHYVIFEHLGSDNEEQQWANYRINEGKGIMMWGNLNFQYNQLTMGFNSNNDITRMGHTSRGFNAKRLIGYAESHDEERLMYKNLQFGSIANSTHNVRNLNVSLFRSSALGAATLLIPGPKMIWHFGELGWEKSLFTCTDGTYNDTSSFLAGDCKLATKPQPQWAENWLSNSNRLQVYNDWAKMIDFKKNLSVFNGDYSINSGTTLTPKIYIWDNSLPITDLKNVVILTNFAVTNQSIVPNFPYTGVWYNLMDNSIINVSNVTDAINIEPGGFRIFGNQPAILDLQNFNNDSIILFPNPMTNEFSISIDTKKVEVYSITGQLISKTENLLTNQTIDVSTLKNGIYLVKITDTNNKTYTKKIIKE